MPQSKYHLPLQYRVLVLVQALLRCPGILDHSVTPVSTFGGPKRASLALATSRVTTLALDNPRPKGEGDGLSVFSVLQVDYGGAARAGNSPAPSAILQDLIRRISKERP